MAKKNINRYIVTNPDGKEYKVDDLNKFCKEHDLWPSNMRKVAQGKAKTSKGWTCGYDDKEPEGEEEKSAKSEKVAEFKKQLEEAEDMWDFRSIAQNIAYDLDNKDWAREIYGTAINNAEDSSEFCTLAEDIANQDYIGDKDWAKEVFNTALEKAVDVGDYCSTARRIVLDLEDTTWARKILESAIEKAEDSYDLRCIAEEVADEDGLGQKKWAREIFQLAVEKAIDYSDLTDLAQSVYNDDYLGDKIWAKKLFEAALDMTNSEDEHEEVVQAREEVLGFEEIEKLDEKTTDVISGRNIIAIRDYEKLLGYIKRLMEEHDHQGDIESIISKEEADSSSWGGPRITYREETNQLFVSDDIDDLGDKLDIDRLYRYLSNECTEDFRIASVAWFGNYQRIVYCKKIGSKYKYLDITRDDWDETDFFQRIVENEGIELDENAEVDEDDDPRLQLLDRIYEELREDPTLLVPGWFDS